MNRTYFFMFIVLGTCLVSHVCFGQTQKATIQVNHPYLKTTLNRLVTDSTQVVYPIKKMGDPHHYHPSVSTLNQFLSADYFISTDLKTTPWAKKIISKRRSPSYAINFQNLGQRPSPEGHFWLFPQLICLAEKQLRRQLVDWKISVKNLESCPAKAIGNRLSTAFSRAKIKEVILGHSSIAPLLKDIGLQTIVIRQGHHHHLGLAKTLELERSIKGLSAPLLIKEPAISLPPRILKKLESKALRVITWDSFHPPSETRFSYLEDLIQKLKGISP
jgi:ABC-type Zn uptake system ZnuABC Zn-binding protein ZnuA